MRIIFLGCGYLGYNLSELLGNKYETEVWGLKSPYTSFSSRFKEINAFNEEELINQYLKDAIIVDTISLVANNATSDDEDKFLEEINNKYINLFKLLKDKKIKQYMFVSSGGTVYGSSDKPIDETYNLHPNSLYAKSKVMVEETLRNSGLNYIITRLSNPYGGYQEAGKRQGVIPILINKALKQEVFELWAEDSSVRDYIYIDDVSNAFDTIIKSNVTNEVFNIGSDVGTSLRNVIEVVENKTNKDILIHLTESEVNIVDSIILDITKLKKLGFSISISIDEGIDLEVKRIKKEISL